MTTTLYTQYLQSALAEWRKRNVWASSIPFEQFPERYREEVELAAYVNMHREGQ
jgi:hypothetical protein